MIDINICKWKNNALSPVMLMVDDLTNPTLAELDIKSNADTMELATMVREVCAQGESSRKLALDILGGLLTYIDAKPNV